MIRIRYIVVCLFAGCLSGYFWGPLIGGNKSANEILVTVFTVLAGFLVAIMTIIGDPEGIGPGSWRRAENVRDKIENRLIRHSWLFFTYLIVIGLIFVSSLYTEGENASAVPSFVHIINDAYAGLGAFAFLLSLALPKMLMDIQRARVDALIEQRRKEPTAPDAEAPREGAQRPT